MQFLLSLILSSFFFISPFRHNGGKVSGTQLITNIENNTPTTNLLDYSICGDYAVGIINSNHRNGSAAQCRLYPFTNFINSVALQNRISFFYEEKHFVLPNLYCKRIGLKLVFPEHYFW
jgi:hypothetical protein